MMFTTEQLARQALEENKGCLILVALSLVGLGLFIGWLVF